MSAINATRKGTSRGTVPTRHKKVVAVVVEENVTAVDSQDILHVNAPTSAAIVMAVEVGVDKANAINAEVMVTSPASAQLIAARAKVVRSVTTAENLDTFRVNVRTPDRTSQSDVTIASSLGTSVATVLRPQVTATIE